MRLAKSARSANGRSARASTIASTACAADAFERRERVVDGVALDLEVDAGAVDRGRLDLDAEPFRLGAEFGELVGIAHVERHRGGEELDRIVRLHVGGLIGDQRVGGGVALVEAVVGEALEQLEDGLGLPAVEPALDAAADEAFALRLHLLADLLAHGATQQVGFAERIAGEDLRRLHHLLLVDDDAEGLAQDRLELGMDVVGLLASVLARAIGRDVRHRARPIERDQRDDVLEPVRAHVEQRPPHALTFQLEDADRFGARQHGVGLLVVERDRRELDLDPAPAHQLDRGLQHGQRLEAEEVELHQARLLDPFHVELGDRHRRFRIAIERHHLGERPVADHDAGGVGRGVAVQSFELLGDVEGAPHHRIAVARRLQARLVVDGAAERDRIERVLRHQLAELVDLAIRHLQHAADVAQHAARLQGAEGDDLRDLVAAVALLHVADHLVAAVLAEVDVEVRHRHALGIEEALEQEPEADRIEVGDGERVGDERAGARAAPGPDRNALPLRPLDEVGDDQEVAGIFHAFDHVELEGEPVAVVVDGAAGRSPVRLDAALEPRLRALAQLGRLVDRGTALADREARQDRRLHARPEGAALRDLDRRGDRLGQIGEQRGHLGARLEAVLGGELAPIGLGDEPAFGDADQRVMRLVILAGGEERLVGGDERKPARIGELDQRRLDQALGRGAVALQLDIEPVAEQALQHLAAHARQAALAGGDRGIERPARAAGERDQAVDLAGEPGELEARRLVRRRFEKGARVEPHQAAVAGLARGE